MNTMSIWHHVLHVYLVTLFKLYSGTYFQYLQIGVSRWPKFTNWRTYRNKWVAYRSLKHLSSPPVFSGILVVRCLGFCVVFCSSSSLFFCPFSFSHCVLCPSLISGFWLHLWYLQVFLKLSQLNVVSLLVSCTDISTAW
jgi:hypothetical protein